MTESNPYPERLAQQAEKVLETADSGAVLVADALLVHASAVDRLAAAVTSLKAEADSG